MQLTVRTCVFGLLALLGAALTWYFNIQFMIAEGGTFNLLSFIQEGFANPAAASLTSDVAVATVAFLVWLPLEAHRLQMRRWWVYALLTVTIAFAFSFPLFLLMREQRLQQIRRGVFTQ